MTNKPKYDKAQGRTFRDEHGDVTKVVSLRQ